MGQAGRQERCGRGGLGGDLKMMRTRAYAPPPPRPAFPQDTDDPDAVHTLMGKMAKQWGALLARSDSELGGVSAADRQAVRAAFQALQAKVERHCPP